MAKRSIHVQGANIAVVQVETADYLSLTDMTRAFPGGSALIEQWLRNKDTLAFLAVWERMYNPAFNSLEFEGISAEAGLNRFYLSVKNWVTATQAIGIQARTGRYGGTYAHRDIAFEFGTWLSPEFKLYLIREFDRLKEAEAAHNRLAWNLNRELAKINYRVHTDGVQANLIPPTLPARRIPLVYASEADLLNLAVFGQTAADWRTANPGLDGNQRDNASIEQLLVLSNLESVNAFLITQGLPPEVRLAHLNQEAIRQLRALLATRPHRRLNPGANTPEGPTQ